MVSPVRGVSQARSLRALIAAAGLAAASSLSHAQDGTDFALEGGPQDLPGVAKGARERPKPEPAPVEPPPPEGPVGEPAKPEEPGEWFGGLPWWEWSRFTGNWGGFRDSLEEKGLTISGSYTLDWGSVWSGGINNRASTKTLFDLNASLDLEKLLGLKGGTIFADFMSTDMRGLEDAGDFQGWSNIVTDENDDQLAELWYEQWLFSKVLRVKVGKVDANTEFAFVDAAGNFSNSSAGISPINFTMPTYPDPAFGINAFVYPTERLYIGLGGYDGAAGGNDGLRTGGHGTRTVFSDDKSSDWFLIGEVGLSWSECACLGRGRIAGGGWYHSGDFDRFDGGVDTGTGGFYGIIEQQLLRRSEKAAEGEEDPGAEQGLFIFGQLGWADDEVSDAELHLGCGLSLNGTFEGRDDDAAGAYVSWVDLSDKAGYEEDETLFELFYKCQCTGCISVKPTVTWVLNPSGDPEVDDAVIGSVRVTVEF